MIWFSLTFHPSSEETSHSKFPKFQILEKGQQWWKRFQRNNQSFKSHKNGHRPRDTTVTSSSQIILSLQQDEWSTEPRFFLICWCRDWRRDRWGQKKYQWTCRWEVWPPHCRRTPLPSQSPRRSRCETVWCWASGWWTALFGRRTRSGRAGWGTSSRGRDLRWSCPSCWLTCWPLPGPNQTSHQRPPGRKATQRQALHLRVEYKQTHTRHHWSPTSQ